MLVLALSICVCVCVRVCLSVHLYGLWVHPRQTDRAWLTPSPLAQPAATKAALNLKIPVGTNSVCAYVCEGTSGMRNSLINHLPYGSLMNSIWTQVQTRGQTKTIAPNYLILQKKKSISNTIYCISHKTAAGKMGMCCDNRIQSPH